jgi:hypothetical protein
MLIRWATDVEFEFCEVRSNSGPGCFLFIGAAPSVIRCLSVRSNICRGSGSWSGLFHRTSGASLPPIRDSVIADNAVDFLVGGSGTLTFENCVFDNFSQAVSGAVFVTSGCIATAFPGVLATCVTTPPASPSPKPTRTQTLGASARLAATAALAESAVSDRSRAFGATAIAAPRESEPSGELGGFWVGLAVGVGTGAVGLALLSAGIFAVAKCWRGRHPGPATAEDESNGLSRTTVTQKTLLDWNDGFLDGTARGGSSWL